MTESGISPRAVPLAKRAIVRTNSDEHDEYGFVTEDQRLTKAMNEKRFRKVCLLQRELETVETTKLYGPPKADVTILSWGSTKGPVREAMRLLNEKGVIVNFVQIVYLQPFPEARVKKVMDEAKKTVVIENNVTSQLSGVIREKLLRDVEHKILKYDGRPFKPGEIFKRVLEVM